MTETLNGQPKDDATDPDVKGGQLSEGPSGSMNAETSGGGADAVPETPDNVPADGAE